MINLQVHFGLQKAVSPHVVICLIQWYLTLSGIWLFAKSNPPQRMKFFKQMGGLFWVSKKFSALGLLIENSVLNDVFLNIAYKISVVRTG